MDRRGMPMPTTKVARAEVRPRRQRTQYSCMACSMAMCLTANGVDADEDTVNEVMGAQPMRGAAWEQALACAQHYGMRATLTVPATLTQVKAWTDKGVPVMIAWNPEGREWSHASVVVDVVPDETHGFMVHVADPNIPDPEQTVRVVTKDEFYKKWYEKWPNYLVRRPAMAVEREITQDGRQVMASLDRQSAYRNWEKERFKRQELRYELRDEDNPGFAARRDERRMVEERAARIHNNMRWMHEKYLYWFALRGWATTQDNPEVLDWVTKVLAYKPNSRPTPNDLAGKLGNMSEEAKDIIQGFLRQYMTGWGSDWDGSRPASPSPEVSLEGVKITSDHMAWIDVFRKNVPPSIQRYEPMAKNWKPYVPPPGEKAHPVQVVKTVVDSALAEKFAILDALAVRGDAAARASADEVRAVYESGGKPTEDQLKRLRNMLYRSRMRDEANHFRTASVDLMAKKPTPVQPKKDDSHVTGKGPARRNPVVQQMIERGSAGAGKHHNREDDVERGRSRKPKHKKRWEDRDAEVLTAAWGDVL